MNIRKRSSSPIGVLLIACFYIFGAILLLALLFINPEQTSAAIAERHGLPASTRSWILPAVAGLGLLIAYGLLSLSRWGFFLTITYLLYFGVINLYFSDATWMPIHCGNAIWSFLVIAYLIIVRKRFFVEKEVHKPQFQK